MRTLLTLFALSVAAAPAARADGSVQIVARAGVARAFGDTANGGQLADTVDWAFPLEAQLQFRLSRQVALGGYARWAPITVPSSCAGCSANDLGLGAVLEVRLSEKPEGGYWLGAFGGYEQLETRVTTSTKLSGFEGGLSGGVDFELGGLFLGPYVSVSAGQYSKTSSGSIASKGVHGFYAGGVRIALLL
jgi:hypothetical protein